MLFAVLFLIASELAAPTPAPTAGAPPGPAPGDTGSICVARIPKNIKKLDDTAFGTPRGRNYHYTFSVQVDALPPMNIVLGEPALISDLPLQGRHVVRIKDGRKTIETFSFTFQARGGPNLCLSYGSGYQTWSLEVPTHGQVWCRCNPRN